MADAQLAWDNWARIGIISLKEIQKLMCLLNVLNVYSLYENDQCLQLWLLDRKVIIESFLTRLQTVICMLNIYP